MKMKKSHSMGSFYSRVRRKFKGTPAEGLVEFAIVLPFFFLLMFGILDLGHFYFVHVTLEHAIRQAGRYAVTGAHEGVKTRVASIQDVATKAATGLDITQCIISSSSGSETGGVGNVNSAGLPGENVTISLTTHLTLFTPLTDHIYGTNSAGTFTESVTFRNELFPYGLRI
jgi:Flp pilus assembly protein TadG